MKSKKREYYHVEVIQYFPPTTGQGMPYPGFLREYDVKVDGAASILDYIEKKLGLKCEYPVGKLQ